MDEKRKFAMAAGICAIGIAAAGVQGYRMLWPRTSIPVAHPVSIADLARQEKKDPGSLTDDQRRLLAAVPASEKQKLLTKPSFNIAAALATIQRKKAPTKHP